MRKLLGILLVFSYFGIGNVCFAQIGPTIVSGQVIDRKTGFPVNKAEILILKQKKTIYTDKAGTFRAVFMSGDYTLFFDHPKYQPLSKSFRFTRDTSIIIRMIPKMNSILLNQVEVRGESNVQLERAETGIERISIKAAEKTLSIGGEKDLVKSLAQLPGVVMVNEGSAEFSVRGGTHDQNLILIEGAPLFNLSNFYGLISPLDTEIIDHFTLYKATCPSRFGGRLSSVGETILKTANTDSLMGSIHLGLLSSGIRLEVPVIRDKISLFISGKRTFLDLLSSTSKQTRLQFPGAFGQFVTKALWRVNSNNTISYSFYSDRDRYQQKNNFTPGNTGYEKLTTDSNNSLHAITWKSKKNIFTNEATINMSEMRFTDEYVYYDQISDYTSSSGFSSGISNLNIRNSLFWEYSDKLNFEAGTNLSGYRFNPVTNQITEPDLVTRDTSVTESQSFLAAAFLQSNWNISSNLILNSGVRMSYYFGDQIIHPSIEPRISFQYKPHDKLSFKLGYSKMSQNIHRLTNPGLGRPVGIWIPAMENLEPQISHQFSLGYSQSFSLKNQNWDIDLQGYYKTYSGLIEFLDGYGPYHLLFGREELGKDNDFMTTGTGSSMGMEFQIKKKTGKTTGFIAYSLSKTIWNFADLNNGNDFLSKFDQPHTFNLSVFHRLKKNIEFTINWSYASGRPFTLGQYLTHNPYWDMLSGEFGNSNNLAWLSTGTTTILTSAEQRNANRMKAFHRLDLGIRIPIKVWKGIGHLELGIMNVYNRKNPYFYFITQEGSEEAGTHKTRYVVQSISLFPIMPSFRININF